MLMDGRNGASGEYRYGFQGQEMDDEIKGKGNSVNYKYRMHDPRVGRFFAVDPLAPKYPHNSPYAFSENRLLDGVELEGLEVELLNDDNEYEYGPIDQKYALSATSKTGVILSMPDGYLSYDPNEVKKVVPDSGIKVKSGGYEMNPISGIDEIIREKYKKLVNLNTRLDYYHSLPGFSMYIGVGQGLTHAPEAATYVLGPELLGAKVSSYLFKAGTFIEKSKMVERTFRVGMNYYGQSITSNGMGFADKDQISLAISFFTPINMNFRTSMAFGSTQGLVSFTYSDGLNGAWNYSFSRITLNSLSGMMTNMMSTPTLSIFNNRFANGIVTNGLSGMLQKGINSIP